MRVPSRLAAVLRFGALLLAGLLAVLIVTVGQDFGPAPVVLRVGEAAPQTFIAPARVSVVDLNATETARSEAAAQVADVYRIDTQVNETVLRAVAEVFATVAMVAEPVLPPETTTTTGAETTTSSTAPGDTTTTSEPTTTTTLPAEFQPRTEQIILVKEAHNLLNDLTIAALVDLVNGDRARLEAGDTGLFPLVRQEAVDIAEEYLSRGIKVPELGEVRSELVTLPRPLVLLPDELRRPAEAAVADVVQLSLQANEFRDDAATQEARLAARQAVPDKTVVFVAGESFVRQGDRLTAVHLQAIEDLGLIEEGGEESPLRAMALVAALMVALASAFVARTAPDLWRRPKMVGLFGLLLVLAALASRVPELVARDRVELGFMLPAALFGYLAASLFDSRVAVLMALPVSAFVALTTGDLALVVFSAAATLTPIPLVSSVSSRTQLNLAVVSSALVHVPLAAAIAWFFYGSDTIVLSAIWGFVSGIASGVAALGVLPVLASIFGITTTQNLLDLTDRNHPALRRIEETAPGTFNHSILVGNLADRASRAVGANPLLARSMAYYHDLGKTVDPKYFVENQFGVTNPHDRLPPIESAGIIRNHVAEGLRLARAYRIPPDVAQGILTHHGTSLMRFFFHKAETANGDDLDPADYRHRGRKPQTKEMVILMLADATEAGTRALVQNEDPTSDSIRELVESIIAEKVEDGQLEESDVTFGELTRIKEAFVDAMIGYYHTRIPYPGFPTARGDTPA